MVGGDFGGAIISAALCAAFACGALFGAVTMALLAWVL